MTDPSPVVTDQSSVSMRTLIGVASIGLALCTGLFGFVVKIQTTLARQEVLWERMATDISDIKRDFRADVTTLNRHMSDPTIHHAGIMAVKSEMEARILVLEQRVGALESP